MFNIYTSERKDAILSAFLMAFSAFFCFVSYELFRSSSESVFLSLYLAKDKVYALALVPLVVASIIFLYSKTIDKKGPFKATVFSFLLAIVLMFVFYYGCVKKVSVFVFSVLVFKEAYIVVLSEIYWSYINSILTLKEAKVLNGYIAGFGAGGSVLGGYLVVKLVGRFGTEALFMVSGGFLIVALMLIFFAYRKTAPSFNRQTYNSAFSSVSCIKNNEILKTLFITVFISQVFSTFADLNFTHHLKKEISIKDIRTEYLGSFWTMVNIFSFTFQFILTPILLRNLSPSKVLSLIPLIHIFSTLYSLIKPSLFSSSLVFFFFKSFDYSVYRSAKETFYIPFDAQVRFKTKQIIDAFNYRFAKGFISVLLSVFNSLKIEIISFLMPLSLFITSVWFFLLKRLDKRISI